MDGITSGCGIKSVPPLPMHRHIHKLLERMQILISPYDYENIALDELDIDIESQTFYTLDTTLVILELIIFHFGVMVLLIKLNYKLANRLKHYLIALCMMTLAMTDYVGDNEFDKVCVGVICWAIYAYMVNIPLLCLLCLLIGLHMSPITLPICMFLVVGLMKRFVVYDLAGNSTIDMHSVQELAEGMAQNSAKMFITMF